MDSDPRPIQGSQIHAGASSTSIPGPSTVSVAIVNAMNGDGSSSSSLQAVIDPGYQDIDSEELSALEDAADAESESDTEIDRILDEAALIFPPGEVTRMIQELKQEGMVTFLQRYVQPDPSKIRHLLIALGVFLPRSIRESDQVGPEVLLPILKTALSRILRRREKLPQYNTVSDALELLRDRKRIMVLSGAGISVSCGIPDFRSKDGIYAQLQSEGKYELDDPQDMFDKSYFMSNPAMFYSFAHKIFPSNFYPSQSHRFIKLLQDKGKLLRNYSQNIDTLEQIAGIDKVMQCHGSFASASCTDPICGYRCAGAEIKDAIFQRTVPECPRCRERRMAEKPKSKKRRKLGNGKTWRPGNNDDDDEEDDEDGLTLPGLGILKPDITFFGEKLSDAFDHALLEDREKVDLLVIMGTSLKVAPVSELVAHIPHSTPVILINKTPIYHIATDIMLLGDSDKIVEYLVAKLGWELPPVRPDEGVVGKSSASALESVSAMAEGAISNDRDENKSSTEAVGLESGGMKEPERLLDSHCWCFEDAETGRLPQLLAEIEQDKAEIQADDASDEEGDSDASNDDGAGPASAKDTEPTESHSMGTLLPEPDEPDETRVEAASPYDSQIPRRDENL